MNSSWSRISLSPLLLTLLFSILFAGCAGMKPYEPRNNREEGPEKGLFSGSQGEFVILNANEVEESDLSEEETKNTDQ